MNKKGSIALVILGLVAVIALVGLILLFTKAGSTGQFMGNYVCTDTERGDIDVYHKGLVTYSGGAFEDTCADNNNYAVSGAGPKLIEYYCRGGAMFTKVQRCTNGCVDGACLVEPGSY
jgi:hypothetical protein